MTHSFQDRLLNLHVDLQATQRSVRDVRKLLLQGLRLTKKAFGSSSAGFAVLDGSSEGVDVMFSLPRAAFWDKPLLRDYILGRRPNIPENVRLAPVGRRLKPWGVLVLGHESPHFTPGYVKALFAVARSFSESVERLDRQRARKVRHKIEHKIARHQEPKDLVYDILHGLRSLTHYDHSASLFIQQEHHLELEAEQIAWKKAKSKRIGLRIELSDEVLVQFEPGEVCWFEKFDGDWLQIGRGQTVSLPRLLAYTSLSDEDIPEEIAMVCAPFKTPDGRLCVLKLSACHPYVLGDYETELVDDFLPLASLAVQFASQIESLHARMLQSERKHVLANVARGIAHDVNNALGSVLPLVQQLQVEAGEGRVDIDVLSKDLEGIENKIRLCRRIFESMLSIARGTEADRAPGHSNLRRAIEEALSLLQDSMERKSIEIDVDLPYELPGIETGQTALTQLFLNLCSNAKDAMPDGGRLNISAHGTGDRVLIAIRDTGIGIPDDHQDKLLEPFFSTKPEGNGLGLSICRSIVWDSGGDMKIESEEGKGTIVHLSLPVLEDFV